MRARQTDRVLTEIAVGVARPGRARTITSGEIGLLTVVSELDNGDLTVNETVGAGPSSLDPHLVAPVIISLAATSPLFREMELEHGLVIEAALSHSCTLGTAINAGDTLMTTSKILSVRASASRVNHYIAQIQDVGVNQHDARVATIDRVILLRQDPPEQYTRETDT